LIFDFVSKKIVLFCFLPLKSLVEFTVELSFEATKSNQRLVKEEQRRKMSDEIDKLVQLNRDKFQSSTLKYSTKPNQSKQVSFF